MAFSLAILDEGITDATKSQLVKQSLYEYDYLFGDAETDNGDPITHANSVFRAAVGVSGAIGFLDLKIGDEFGGLNGLVELALRDLAAIGPSYGLATINMSFSTSRYPVYADEIASLAQHGVLVVAASGNDGSHDALERLPFPARLPGVITVGSHDGRGNPSDFSSNGPGVDLLADGEGVPRPNAFGTSYAAPQVAVTVTHVQAIAQGLAGSRLDTAGMIDVLHQGGAGPLSRADPADGRTRYFLHDHEGALDYAWSRSGGTPTRALEYVASHGDLVAAIGADPEAGRRHFEHAGSVEGRSITFDALAYLATYDDLLAAFGGDPLAAAGHYLVAGRLEGRGISFAGLDYIASFGDLAAAFGADSAAGTAHFVANGFAEGRARDLFDAAQYLRNYADLQAAFGTDEAAATRHFIVNGLAEGRTDAASLVTADFMM